jgi:hypothetical protein
MSRSTVRSNGGIAGALAVVLIVLTSASAAADGSSVVLSRIKFRVNGESYSWDGTSPLPETPAGQTNLDVLLSYTSLQPGAAYTPSTIERRVEDWRLRLEDTGVFYRADVSIVPPNRYPERRTVLVTVDDGFRQAYGGGSIFAYWALRNIAGTGKSLETSLGLNVAEVSLYDRALVGRRVSGQARVGYDNWGVVFDETRFHRYSAGASIGYRITPGVTSLAGFDVYLQRFPGDVGAEWSTNGRTDIRPNLGFAFRDIAQPEPSLRVIVSGDTLVGTVVPLTGVDDPTVVTSANLGMTTAFSLTHIQAVGALAWAQRGVPNLFETDLSLGERAIVRSGWDPELLRSETFVWLSLELGRDLASLGRAFPAIVRPFLFTDHAILHDLDYDTTSGPRRHVDAYGGGVKLVFDNPVNATFALTAGINNEGDHRIVFRQEFSL